jgi:ribosome-associated heat shock protein Hsp15
MSARDVVIRALIATRGPATVAQTMYEETAASLARRAAAASARRLASEPAHAITQGRPTKRDRRAIERTHVDWQRWSASIDPA